MDEGVEIDFPIEFHLQGLPVSPQGSRRGLDRWKKAVADAARNARGPERWCTDEPIGVTVLFLLSGEMPSDLDNPLKPILDAMIGVLYLDDRQIMRILARKFEPDRPIRVGVMTSALEVALAAEKPIMYVRVEDADLSGAWDP